MNSPRRPKNIRRRHSTPLGSRTLRAVTQKGVVRRHRLETASIEGGAAGGSRLNSKVVMGLVILIVFHLVAVGAIAMHSKYYKSKTDNPVVSAKTPETDTNTTTNAQQTTAAKPEISSNEYAWVLTGDTYESIAQRRKVDVEELRKLNRNRELKAGIGIKIPSRKIEVISPEVEAVRQASQEPVAILHPTEPTPAETRNTGAVTRAEQYTVHTFKSGDTFWGLSRQYSVTVDAIKAANPKLNPNKVRVGTKVNIPQ